MTDFEVMDEMAKKDKEIYLFTTVHQVDKKGDLCTVSIRVDDKTVMDELADSDKYYLALYKVNKKEFLEIKRNKTSRHDSSRT